MNCSDLKPLIDGYFDEELDLVRSLEVEKHLAACDSCAAHLAELKRVRTWLHATPLREAAPERLRRWVEALEEPRTAPSHRRFAGLLQGWGWQAAAAAALVMLSVTVTSQALRRTRAADEVVSIHVRSLMAQHLTDVVSSDQHTVKPWFNGKVDFAPTVRDFAEYGFPLKGGRLEYAFGRPAVALVYQRHQHAVNLLVAPAAAEPDLGTHTLTRRGFNLVHWTRAGMVYWSISDLNLHELKDFSELVQRQLAS